MAKVALSFDSWKSGEVRPATVEVPVQIINAVESPQHLAALKGHEGRIWQIAWAADCKTLVSLAIGPPEVRVWDVAERRQRPTTLQSDLGPSLSLALTPDGKTLLLSHRKNDAKDRPTGGISLWDVATGQRTGLLQQSPPRAVAQLALSPDGTTLAAGEDRQVGSKKENQASLTLWDLASGKAKVSEDLPDGSSNVFAFTADSKTLLRAVYFYRENKFTGIQIYRHNLSTGQDLPSLANPISQDLTFGLGFSPDGRMLAGADSDGSIFICDTTSAKVLTTLKQEGQRRIASLAFSPDGRTLASAVGSRPGHDHDPGLVVLWDVATGRQRATLTGHTNAVWRVAFSPDGKLLASGGADRAVRLWDVASMLQAKRD